MDYKKHYDSLIERGKNRTLKGYKETHHILPRCLGGTDDPDNLVDLTAEEHFLAHQLLVKIYPQNENLIYACHRMAYSKKDSRSNNKMYGWLRKRFSNKMRSDAKKRIGSKNGSYGKSWYHNPVTLESGKFDPNSIPYGWEKGRTPLPKCKYCGVKTETKNSTCCSSCRNTISRKRNRGYFSHSDQAKNNIANTRKRRVWIFNPVLNKVTNIDKDDPLPEGWFYGKKIKDISEINLPEKTKEQKEKERREKISKYNKGRPKSKEHREKLREAALRKSNRE